MSRFTIYASDGTARATSPALEYHGEWMGECYVTLTVKTHAPIAFAIGDYVEYRGERYELNYRPACSKQAARDSYGEAFVYENIKFNALSDELTRCDFLDVTLQDNEIHYTQLPTFSFYAASVQDLADRIQANLDRLYKDDKAWTVEVHSEYAEKTNVSISVSNIKVWGALELAVNEFGCYFVIRNRTIVLGTAGIPTTQIFKYGKGQGLRKIEEQTEDNDAIITRLRAYGNTRNMPLRYYNKILKDSTEAYLPNNMAVSNLMLPGFPTETTDPYIDSANASIYGVREATVFFDGTDGLEDIYPSIEGMTSFDLIDAGMEIPEYNRGELDVLVGATQVEDDGEEKEGMASTAIVITRYLGFDLNEHFIAGDTPKMSMRDGLCGGREFEITKVEIDSVGTYRITLKREYDESLGLYFPNSFYNLKPGDSFVFIGIEMPEIYIQTASQRLLKAAKTYLDKNDKPRSVFQPEVDAIFMARQHDDYVAGNADRSLHDTIKEGDLMLFKDDDLSVEGSIVIDNLTIKEKEDEIPTYEVILREEKSVGSLEKIQNQIDSLAKAGSSSSSNVGTLINQLTEGVTKVLADLNGRIDSLEVFSLSELEGLTHIDAETVGADTIYANRIAIGEGEVTWDDANKAFKFSKALYSEEWVSALGASAQSGSGTGAGISEEEVLAIIDQQGYAKQIWVTNNYYNRAYIDGNFATISSVTALSNTVDSISAAVNNLATTVSGINTTVGSLSTTASSLSTALAALDEDASKTLADLNGRIDALEVFSPSELEGLTHVDAETIGADTVYANSVIIGDGEITYDEANKALQFHSALYSDEWISALGASAQASATAGINEEQLEAYLEAKNYATQDWVTTTLGSYATISWVNSQLSGNATQSWVTTQLGCYYTKSEADSKFATIAKLDALTATVSGHTSDISALQGRMTTAEGNIASLRTDLTALQGTVSTLDTNVSKVLADLNGRIDSLEVFSPSELEGLTHVDAQTIGADTLYASTLVIGDGTVTWDEANGGFHFDKGLYSDEWVSALGASAQASATAGINEEQLQDYLDSHQYATQNWVTTQLGSYATTSWVTTALGSYATTAWVTTTLGSYATTSWVSTQLGSYYTKTETDSKFATTAWVNTQLGNYYTKSDADAKFATIAWANTQLANYYTKTEADAKFATIAALAALGENASKVLAELSGRVDSLEVFSPSELEGLTHIDAQTVGADTIFANALVIGDGTLTYDETNKAFRFDKGIYSDEFVSALGSSAQASATAGINEEQLAAYLTSHGYLKAVQASGAGNAVTSVSQSGQTAVVTLGQSFALSTHSHSVTASTSDTGNAVTGITASGMAITYSKGNFATQSAFSSLENTVNGHTADIADALSRISTLETWKTSAQSSISDYATRLGVLEAWKPTVDTALSEHATAIQNTANSLSALQSNVSKALADLNGRIDSLEMPGFSELEGLTHIDAETIGADTIYANALVIGDGMLTYDETNKAFHFDKGLYSDEFISALGASAHASATAGINETQLQAYLVNNAYLKTVDTTGSGDAVVSVAQSGQKIVATKGGSFASGDHTHSGLITSFSTSGAGNAVKSVTYSGGALTVTLASYASTSDLTTLSNRVATAEATISAHTAQISGIDTYSGKALAELSGRLDALECFRWSELEGLTHIDAETISADGLYCNSFVSEGSATVSGDIISAAGNLIAAGSSGITSSGYRMHIVGTGYIKNLVLTDTHASSNTSASTGYFFRNSSGINRAGLAMYESGSTCKLQLGAYDTITNGAATEIYGTALYFVTGAGSSSIVARMMLTSAGNLGIGVSSVSRDYRLHVGGKIYSTSDIYANGAVSALGVNSSSDIRLKTAIEDYGISVGELASLRAVRYRWRQNGEEDFGVIAQELQGVMPLAVREGREGFLGVGYGKAALVGAITLAKAVEDHERRIKELESKIA